MRSAEAAKNTAVMIEDTVKKIMEGSAVATRTNGEFSEVANSATRIGELVSEIADASQEQSQGVSEISAAVADLDRVIQKKVIFILLKPTVRKRDVFLDRFWILNQEGELDVGQ
ncbi:MAG: methyl-accepting chemotaxis protein [Atribacterota bacterium]